MNSPAVPVVRDDDWSRTSVDRFVLAKLRDHDTGATAEGALLALNAPFVWDLAKRLAKRVEVEVGSEPGLQVEHLYRRLLSRPPTDEEPRIGLGLLKNEED